MKEHGVVEIRFKWLLHAVIYICVNGDFNGLFLCLTGRLYTVRSWKRNRQSDCIFP
jgi:hypothetical protein